MNKTGLKFGVALLAFVALFASVMQVVRSNNPNREIEDKLSSIRLDDEHQDRRVAFNGGGGGIIGGVTPGDALSPTQEQGQIAKYASRSLSKIHFASNLPKETISDRFWSEYLNALDPRRLYFLESDVQEFEKYRTSANQLLIDSGDTTPGFLLYQRLLQRAEEQNAYVMGLLKEDKFEFTTNDEYSLDRKNAPRPKTLDDAKKGWQDYLRYEYLQEKLASSKPEKIVDTLKRRYKILLSSLKEQDRDDVFQLYIESLAHAYDPHSDYLGKVSYDNFNISMKLSLFGIGALLQSEDGYCKIVELTPGGPALRSGQLSAGDRIIAVAQDTKEPVDAVGMKVDKIVEMIRGQKGTKVRITVLPAGSTNFSNRKVVELVREEIKLENQEAKAKIIDMPDGAGKTVRLGVIDLPSFYADFDSEQGKNCTDDVRAILERLKKEKVQGIILDLRRNPGGSLQEVIRLTGLFIKKGPIVQVKNSDGRVRADHDDDPSVVYSGPLMVMTSRFSASASEILAAALQDHGRALVVGDTHTFGKGTVQTVIPLREHMERSGVKLTSEPGALKLTVQKFYRATGSSTQVKGVVPDLILPSVANHLETGEKHLSNPLVWDTVGATSYIANNQVKPYLAELKRRSDARLAKDKDFEYLREDITLFKELQQKKRVSMNEETRRKEKQNADAREKARKTERASRAVPTDKVYVLALKDVAKPGLVRYKETAPKRVANSASQTPGQEIAGSALDDDNVPLANDMWLREAEHILRDFINLTTKSVAVK